MDAAHFNESYDGCSSFPDEALSGVSNCRVIVMKASSVLSWTFYDAGLYDAYLIVGDRVFDLESAQGTLSVAVPAETVKLIERGERATISLVDVQAKNGLYTMPLKSFVQLSADT